MEKLIKRIIKTIKILYNYLNHKMIWFIIKKIKINSKMIK
jgi:hypothetical protein